MTGVKFSIIDLLQLVEQRPALWKKCSKDYKYYIEKRKAWKEIFRLLIKDFDLADAERQRNIGWEITEKWRNLKDAFNRSLRKQSATGKKYVYYDHISFLLKSGTKEELDWNNGETSFEQSSMEELTSEEQNFYENTIQQPLKTHFEAKPLKRKSSISELDKALIKALKKAATSIEPSKKDEDEAFFASVLPSVRRMNDEEKLEFRIGVLRIIQRIVQKRNSVRLDTDSTEKDIKPFVAYDEISVGNYEIIELQTD